MEILLNDTSVIIPSSLEEMTLGQRIDFYNAHGRALDEELAALLEMPEGIDRSMAEMEFTVNKAFRTVAFFANVDPATLRASGIVDEVIAIYHSCLQSILEEEDALELVLEHELEGEKWVIAPPKLDASSEMTYGEFIDSKVIMQNLAALGNSQWESLQNLAAIYLRREGEAYDETFLYPDSDRLKLMRELPMSVAIHVGFFLTSSVNIWLNTSRSSGNLPVNPAPTLPSTLTNGAG